MVAPPKRFSVLIKEAQACADRAVSLKPDSGWVQGALAGIRHQSGDPEGAIRHYDRALAFEPSHADATFMLGYQLGAVGRHLDHARLLMRRAGELDPLTPHNLGGLGWVRWFEGEFLEAVDDLTVFWEAMGKAKSPFRHFLAYLLAAGGNPQEAIGVVDQMVDDSPDHPMTSGMLFLKQAWLGNREAALGALTDEWLEAARWDDICLLYMADGYALIGELDLAHEWLDATIEYGIRNPDYLRYHDPFLKPLRATSHFSELMKKADSLSERVTTPSVSINLLLLEASPTATEA
jgi:tetratricopeptide (TPR) repeat protein